MRYRDLIKKVKELEKRLDESEKTKHKFKVGDRVQFKSWEEMEKDFGTDTFGNIKVERSFTPEMKHLCGTYATIARLNSEICKLKDFTANGETDLWIYSLDMLKPAVDEPKWKFTEDEKVILRNVDEKYKWIVRDEDDYLCVYTGKPEKKYYDKAWAMSSSCEYKEFNCFNHLFKTIKWEDEEPCEFRKYI